MGSTPPFFRIEEEEEEEEEEDNICLTLADDEPTQPNLTTGLDLASQTDWQEISSGGGKEGSKKTRITQETSRSESEAVTGVKNK